MVKRYPWEKWFKKDKFTLWQGTDYHCMQQSMSVQIRSYASKQRMRVSVFLYNNGEIQVIVRQRNNGKTKTKATSTR